MTPLSFQTPDRREEILLQIRDARFAHGVTCPRCGARKVCRWGRFAGRQRYRCAKCCRTFSDLTGSPAAYSKKLESWPRYCQCMEASWSIRRAAAYVGIHTSTSFRWRHAILRCLGQLDDTGLEGLVEVHYFRLLHSLKGSRKLTRPARRRGMFHDLRFRLRTPNVTVTVARDRRGNVVTTVTDAETVFIHDLKADFVQHLRNVTALICENGQFGPQAIAARLAGVGFIRVRQGIRYDQHPLHHTNNVRGYIRQVRLWFLRFRGVATRYLKNYLVWHRQIHRTRWLRTPALFARWPLGRMRLKRADRTLA